MNTEHHHWESGALGQRMELKVYGWQGRPVLVFPSSRGSFHQFEDFGMVEACRTFIEGGRVKLFTVGSVDNQSWWNEGAHPADKARRHQQYDEYIVHEVVPFIHDHCRIGPLPIIAAGCSFGAYHAVNFLLRHPDLFDTAISLSGVYTVARFVSDYCDDNIYYNDPMKYLPDLEDPWYLDRIRRSRIIICCGRGAWEWEFLEESKAFSRLLERKGIDHWFDVWGLEVNHDWPWWQKQLAHFLGTLDL